MLSYSQISLFEKCPMKWYRQYILQEFEPESPVLKFGSIVHKTLETFLWGCKLDLAIKDNEKDLPIEERAKLRNLVWLAIDTVQKEFKINLSSLDNSQFKNNGIEEELVYNNFKGIIDLILSIENKVFILDWKTTSQDYTDHQIRSSDQLICYSWLLDKIYHIIPDRVFYVTLNKKTETCKLYSTTISEQEMNCWEHKVEIIKRLIEDKVNYKNTSNCVMDWGKCFYYDQCWSNKKVNLPSTASVPRFGGR